jgi:hypothetical protein
MTGHLTPETEAMISILRGISREMRRQWIPNTAICPVDGCLLRSREKCPACKVRTAPRFCSCGTRIRMKSDKPDETQCSRCRKRPATPTDDNGNRRPMRWVRQGLIWRPVYEQSEVA